MSILTKEEIEEGLINLEGWKFQAWRAFVECNEVRDCYKDLSSTKKVNLAHTFYDYIFRVSEAEVSAKPRFVEISVHLEEEKSCKDHPFSARVAHRAIMLDNQWLLDDFEVFKESFLWLASNLLSISPTMNQRVKIRKDGDGDVIVPGILEDRYSYGDGTPMRFFDEDTKNYVDGFPLKIMPWYAEFEKSRVPLNLTSFF